MKNQLSISGMNQSIKMALSAIWEKFRLPSDKSDFETIRRLTPFINQQQTPNHTWTPNYFLSIFHGYMEISKGVEKALHLAEKNLSQVKKIDYFTSVSVIAPIGTVKQGSILDIPSCDCIICERSFIPRSHNHIYCSKQCKNKARRLRERKENV